MLSPFPVAGGRVAAECHADSWLVMGMAEVEYGCWMFVGLLASREDLETGRAGPLLPSAPPNPAVREKAVGRPTGWMPYLDQMRKPLSMLLQQRLTVLVEA